MISRIDESQLSYTKNIFLCLDNPNKTDRMIIQSPYQYANVADTKKYKTYAIATKTDLALPSYEEAKVYTILITQLIKQGHAYTMAGSSGYINPMAVGWQKYPSEEILSVCGVQILHQDIGQIYSDIPFGSLDLYSDQTEDLFERSHVEELEGGTLESSLIADMSQIPEVDSIYMYQEGEHTTFFTILNETKYQRSVHMKVYEVEYNVGRMFPEANIGFECLPKLALDDNLLPVGIKKVYVRESL